MSDIKMASVAGPNSLSALRKVAVPQGPGSGSASITVSQKLDSADVSASRLELDEEEPKLSKKDPWANLFGHC